MLIANYLPKLWPNTSTENFHEQELSPLYINIACSKSPPVELVLGTNTGDIFQILQPGSTEHLQKSIKFSSEFTHFNLYIMQEYTF